MTNRLKALFTLAVPVAGLAVAAWWLPSMVGGGGPSLTYDTAEVTRGSIRKIVSTSGPVRAVVTVSVGSQLSGQIETLKADFNSEVKAGDEMATIDDKTFVSKVAQAKADLAAARAMLTNQEAALTKAQAVRTSAERLVTRQEALAAKGVAAQATLDNAQRDRDVAEADIAVARAQIENAKATILQREAQLAQAQIDLDRTRIRSPINGTVISRTIDVGQTVAASLQAPELFKIAQDLRHIRIEAQVNEADVGAVREGNLVEFTVDSYPERTFTGKVTQVRLAATELNNVVTYTVIIEAANDDRKLFPGMTANAQVESLRKDGALRIPTDVLRFKPREGAATVTASTQRGERQQQMVERLKGTLQLTDAQVQRLSQELKAVFAARPANGPSGGTAAGSPFGGRRAAAPSATGTGDGAGGGRVMQQVEQIVASVITDDQRPAFEKWKAERVARPARNGARPVTVWVLNAEQMLEPRQVRIGASDDQFAEVLGGGLKEGDRVVLRARDATKK